MDGRGQIPFVTTLDMQNFLEFSKNEIVCFETVLPTEHADNAPLFLLENKQIY